MAYRPLTNTNYYLHNKPTYLFPQTQTMQVRFGTLGFSWKGFEGCLGLGFRLGHRLPKQICTSVTFFGVVAFTVQGLRAGGPSGGIQ